MSIDYGDRERQFLEALKADSGRTLDEWMAAIAAEGLSHRNDIIDWLRRQGFMFSKASWLERIHNNGGRPIYADTASPRPQTRPRPRPRLVVVSAQPPAMPAAAAPQQPPLATARPVHPDTPPSAQPPTPAPASPPADQAAIDALLARAKAYRPLATYMMAEIRKAVPEAVVLPHDGFLAFRARETDFAVLAISAKLLRLGLALKAAPAGVPLEPAKLPGLRGAPAATHMIVLTDARQVTAALLAAVAQAASGT